jgi:SNF2 family DNA or RNA helicase
VVDDGKRISAPKFEQLIKFLSKSSGKALVFSHYLSKGIDVASEMLTRRNIPFTTFTGRETQKQKKEAVDAYNHNRVRVMLLSPAGGVGLDLKETESVHIMDPGWNEAETLQAIYRAVRYKSHTKKNAVVKVYRYYCRKTYKSPTPSADMYLLQVSKKKEEINTQFLDYAGQHTMETKKCGKNIGI